jgi:hypothetical protein
LRCGKPIPSFLVGIVVTFAIESIKLAEVPSAQSPQCLITLIAFHRQVDPGRARSEHSELEPGGIRHPVLAPRRLPDKFDVDVAYAGN